MMNDDMEHWNVQDNIRDLVRRHQNQMDDCVVSGAKDKATQTIKSELDSICDALSEEQQEAFWSAYREEQEALADERLEEDALITQKGSADGVEKVSSGGRVLAFALLIAVTIACAMFFANG
ncbi:hypothetical protein ADIMK_1133 [Marinobacterium lacunae]|uniref:Uncharacterized protein n=2 Tax=Marinobacterium lacunae TaxID=1232683 RepID=A0A081G1M5_9GAMM|nr:hypothetical protein ADIMK_1133 [Marinobacterium lacunae]